jgi:hypothetical protein
MGYKFALLDSAASHAGGLVHMHRGDTWDADDPFVKAHPDWFDDNPPVVRSTTGNPPQAPVEQATRAPGERRTIRRG